MRFYRSWLLLAAFTAACSGKKQQEREDKARAMMQSFFIAPSNPGIPMSGLWIADRESVAALIEKKYLASYVAKPDEMQASEIRERLKSLTIYFRIQGTQIAMLTFVADSFGITGGDYTPRPGVPHTYDAVMRGKGESKKVVYRYLKKGGTEMIEYEEAGLVMKAKRETVPPAELIETFLQRLKSGTGLTQY